MFKTYSISILFMNCSIFLKLECLTNDHCAEGKVCIPYNNTCRSKKFYSKFVSMKFFGTC